MLFASATGALVGWLAFTMRENTKALLLEQQKKLEEGGCMWQESKLCHTCTANMTRMTNSAILVVTHGKRDSFVGQ